MKQPLRGHWKLPAQVLLVSLRLSATRLVAAMTPKSVVFIDEPPVQAALEYAGLSRLTKDPKLPNVGCGAYPLGSHLHVDNRSTKTIWIDLSRYGETADYVRDPNG